MKRREVLLAISAVATTALVGTASASASRQNVSASIAHGFHATMKARPGQGHALVALLFEAPSFENPDCKVFLIGRSKSDPDLVFITEGWVDEAAHKRFTDTDEAKAYIARFGPLVEKSSYSDELPVGGKAVLT